MGERMVDERVDHTAESGDYEHEGSLNDLIDWLCWARAQIPQDSRRLARVEWRSVHEDMHQIAVFYRRPETPAEAAIRLRAERAHAARVREKELAELARLRLKYEVPAPGGDA